MDSTTTEANETEMQLEAALQRALELIEPWVTEIARPAERRLDVVVAAEDLIAVVAALMNNRWGYLSSLTGLDLGPEEGVIEALYHFSEGADVLGLRVRLDRDNPQTPTICGVIPSAGYYERELSEMFGVTVRDTPDPRRLFLPEDWPAGVYPLRKDYAPEAENE